MNMFVVFFSYFVVQLTTSILIDYDVCVCVFYCCGLPLFNFDDSRIILVLYIVCMCVCMYKRVLRIRRVINDIIIKQDIMNTFTFVNEINKSFTEWTPKHQNYSIYFDYC